MSFGICSIKPYSLPNWEERRERMEDYTFSVEKKDFILKEGERDKIFRNFLLYEESNCLWQFSAYYCHRANQWKSVEVFDSTNFCDAPIEREAFLKALSYLKEYLEKEA